MFLCGFGSFSSTLVRRYVEQCSDPATDNPTKKTATKRLSDIARRQRESVRSVLVENGALQPLLTLATSSDDAKIRRYAMRALVYLSANPFVTQELIQLGAVRLMQGISHVEDVKLLRYALRLMKNLVMFCTNRHLYIADGGLIPLIDLLHHPDYNIEIAALTVLSFLSIFHDAQLTIADAQAAPTLIQLLNSNDKVASKNALICLSNMTAAAEIRRYLVQQNILEPLFMILASNSLQSDIQVRGMVALSFGNLAFDNYDNKQVILAHPALSFFLQLVHSPEPALFRKAGRSLSILCSALPEVLRIAHQHGISHWLRLAALPDEFHELRLYGTLTLCQLADVRHRCEMCGVTIGERETRYHCSVCDDFDLCSDCYQQTANKEKLPGMHNRGHFMSFHQRYFALDILSSEEGLQCFYSAFSPTYEDERSNQLLQDYASGTLANCSALSHDTCQQVIDEPDAFQYIISLIRSTTASNLAVLHALTIVANASLHSDFRTRIFESGVLPVLFDEVLNESRATSDVQILRITMEILANMACKFTEEFLMEPEQIRRLSFLLSLSFSDDVQVHISLGRIFAILCLDYPHVLFERYDGLIGSLCGLAGSNSTFLRRDLAMSLRSYASYRSSLLVSSKGSLLSPPIDGPLTSVPATSSSSKTPTDATGPSRSSHTRSNSNSNAAMSMSPGFSRPAHSRQRSRSLTASSSMGSVQLRPDASTSEALAMFPKVFPLIVDALFLILQDDDDAEAFDACIDCVDLLLNPVGGASSPGPSTNAAPSTSSTVRSFPHSSSSPNLFLIDNGRVDMVDKLLFIVYKCFRTSDSLPSRRHVASSYDSIVRLPAFVRCASSQKFDAVKCLVELTSVDDPFVVKKSASSLESIICHSVAVADAPEVSSLAWRSLYALAKSPSTDTDVKIAALNAMNYLHAQSAMASPRGVGEASTIPIKIKCSYGEEMRSLQLPKSDASFQEASNFVMAAFNLQTSPSDAYVLQYKDDDGDMITIKNDAEWSHALSMNSSKKDNKGALRLTIRKSVTPEPIRLSSDLPDFTPRTNSGATSPDAGTLFAPVPMPHKTRGHRRTTSATSTQGELDIDTTTPQSARPLSPAPSSRSSGGRNRNRGLSGNDMYSTSPPRSSMAPPKQPFRWRKGEFLGSGAYGKVYLGLDSTTGRLIAIKEVPVAKSVQEGAQLEKEIALMKTLEHPNIVQYLGVERDNPNSLMYIFLEYVPGGSIQSLIRKFGRFDEMVIRRYLKQILTGLAYLHDNGIVHRDIKGANILVDDKGNIKLADFGASKTLATIVAGPQQGIRSLAGSPFWMSPEMIKQSGHDKETDIWSVGCTVYEMFAGNPPWSHLQVSNQFALMYLIASAQEPPPLPENVSISDEGRDFLRLCFQRNPADRPSVHELLRHPFVAGIDAEEQVVSESEESEEESVDVYDVSVEKPEPVPERMTRSLDASCGASVELKSETSFFKHKEYLRRIGSNLAEKRKSLVVAPEYGEDSVGEDGNVPSSGVSAALRPPSSNSIPRFLIENASPPTSGQMAADDGSSRLTRKRSSTFTSSALVIKAPDDMEDESTASRRRVDHLHIDPVVTFMPGKSGPTSVSPSSSSNCGSPKSAPVQPHHHNHLSTSMDASHLHVVVPSNSVERANPEIAPSIFPHSGAVPIAIVHARSTSSTHDDVLEESVYRNGRLEARSAPSADHLMSRGSGPGTEPSSEGGVAIFPGLQPDAGESFAPEVDDARRTRMFRSGSSKKMQLIKEREIERQRENEMKWERARSGSVSSAMSSTSSHSRAASTSPMSAQASASHSNGGRSVHEYPFSKDSQVWLTERNQHSPPADHPADVFDDIHTIPVEIDDDMPVTPSSRQ